MNNTFFLKSAPLLLAASLALGGASAAQAQVTLNYALGSYALTAPNADADFYSLATGTQTLTLMPGVAQTVNIQTVYFDVNPTSDNGDDYTGTLSRTLTIDGVTHSAAQNYDLTTNPGGSDPAGSTLYADDSLIFYPGDPTQTVEFDLGSKGTLSFTPEVLDGEGIFDADADTSTDGGGTATYQTNVKGKFLLTPAAVPEASTTISFGLLLAGLGLLGVYARKRSASQG